MEKQPPYIYFYVLSTSIWYFIADYRIKGMLQGVQLVTLYSLIFKDAHSIAVTVHTNMLIILAGLVFMD